MLGHLYVEQASVLADIDCHVSHVNMRIPDNCGANCGRVVRLEIPIYGVKQARRFANAHLADIDRPWARIVPGRPLRVSPSG